MAEARRAVAMARTEQGVWLEDLMLGGLVLLIVALPFQLVIKSLVPGPLGTYWKEILLGLLVVAWLCRCLQERRLLLTGTALDLAVLIYLGLLLLAFIVGRATPMAAWGLYVSAMYAPLFWVVPVVMMRRPAWVERLAVMLAGIGGLVALGGVLEFILNKPLWPSAEMASRQGFPDVFVYGTQLRRVYFVLDSPTVLANMLSMLLPLALVGILLARRPWLRAALAACAALMAACIVVTFSRGIWIATLVALIMMVLASDFVQQRRRLLLAAAAVLVPALITWAAVAAVQPGHVATPGPATLELPSAAYAGAPIAAVSADLLSANPENARAATQTWSMDDPIEGRVDARTVLYQAPLEGGKDAITYKVTVPASGALRFGLALSPEVWSPEKGDGVNFQVTVADPITGQNPQQLFARYINPKLNPSDRRWRNFMVDLSPWAGRTVELTLTTSSGPAGDWGYDWAGWAAPQVVSVPQGFFASAQAGNEAVQHAGSVANWTTDETNRDRLLAWSTALAVWRASPVLGRGLGSTGVAALRTNAMGAFVTESQVLKSLVELGIPGLLVLAYLWFQIARVGYRTYRRAADPRIRLLLLGILTGLLIVFAEGWVYQNLEVKQVNAYFWILVGTVGYLASNPGGLRER